MSNPIAPTTVDADASRLRDVTEELLASLKDAERDTLWLRFFEGASFAEIGARFRVTESAARMRVERALEKLRHKLARRGVASTPAILAAALTDAAAGTAPAGLATTVTSGALAGTDGLSLVSSLLAFATNAKVIATGASAVAVASVGMWFAPPRTPSPSRTESSPPPIAAARDAAGLTAAADTIAELRRENERLAKVAAESAAEVTTLLQAIERLRIATDRAKAIPAPVAMTGPTYFVKPGDNAMKMAQALGTDVKALLAANPDTNFARLRVGQVLQLPPGVIAPAESSPAAAPVNPTPTTAPVNGWLEIQRGDSAVKLAAQARLTVEQLRQLNPGTDWAKLTVGQKIRTDPQTAP